MEYEYEILYKVAEIVLTILHSNAGEEAFFLLSTRIRHLDIKGTLS